MKFVNGGTRLVDGDCDLNLSPTGKDEQFVIRGSFFERVDIWQKLSNYKE
jgi:hypothetical protein